jgi:hypothetical protein
MCPQYSISCLLGEIEQDTAMSKGVDVLDMLTYADVC